MCQFSYPFRPLCTTNIREWVVLYKYLDYVHNDPYSPIVSKKKELNCTSCYFKDEILTLYSVIVYRIYWIEKSIWYLSNVLFTLFRTTHSSKALLCVVWLNINKKLESMNFILIKSKNKKKVQFLETRLKLTFCTSC